MIRLRAAAVAATALLLALGVGARAAPAGNPVLTPPPTSDGHPLVVKVGLRLEHVGAVDADADSFSFAGTFHFLWRDPRLAFVPAPGEQRRAVDPGSIWTPTPVLANLIDYAQTHYRAATVQPDGTVHLIWEMSAKLAPNLRLRRFPFDSQKLVIEVRPPFELATPMVFLADRGESGLVPAARSELPLWELTGYSVHDARDKGFTATGRDGADFEVRVTRRWGYYVLRLFLPLGLILLASWAFLVLRLDDIQNQLYATFGTLLSVIAFAFAVQSLVPQVPVLTLYDRFYLLCFAVVVLELGEVCVVHVLLHRYGERSARRVRRIGRVALPLLSVAGGAALFLVALF